MDLATESARREQAEKNMARMVTKAGRDTRIGVTEDLKKSPIKIDVPHPEPLKVTSDLLLPTSGEEPPYETKFVATVNQTVQPVKLIVHCESEILHADGSFLDVGVHLKGGWGGRFTGNMFGIGITSPSWSPSMKMVITVKSNKKPLGPCRIYLN
jgi:hypothetical protein